MNVYEWLLVLVACLVVAAGAIGRGRATEAPADVQLIFVGLSVRECAQRGEAWIVDVNGVRCQP